MSIVRRIFPSDTDALRPRLACEITPGGVLGARPGSVAEAGEAQDVVTQFAPLRLGVLVPGLKVPAMTDRAAISSAIGQALEPIAERAKKVTVIVPDASVRVLLLDFDTLPVKTADVLPILRFRLRKLVHFDVDDAAISWQVLPKNGDETMVRTVVAVMPAAVRAEYEDAVREAGYEPGAVLSSSLAALAAVPGEDPALLVNRNATLHYDGHCAGTAVAAVSHDRPGRGRRKRDRHGDRRNADGSRVAADSLGSNGLLRRHAGLDSAYYLFGWAGRRERTGPAARAAWNTGARSDSIAGEQ